MSESVRDPVGGRTAQDLAAMALERNGEVLAGRHQIEAARGGLTQARLRPNPSVDVLQSNQVAGSMNNFMVSGSLPLELFHRRDRRVEVSAAGVRMSEFDQSDRERRSRGEVEAKFGEALADLRNLQFSEELLELNRKALELLQKRVEQGSSAPLDANMLRVEVNRIDALRSDFESRLAVTILELKNLAGLRPDDDLRLKGTLEPAPLAVSKDEAIAYALKNRPDLLSARAAEEAADARLKQAHTEARPDASISANYQRMDSSFDLNGLTDSGQVRPIQGIFHYLSVGVSISLPVRNRNEGAIQTAVAQIEEARRRREYLELTVSREVSAAFLAQEKAKESLDIYSRGVRDQARENLDVIRKVYELGRSQLLDVIAEQRRFIDVETGYTEALNRYYQASVRVRTAAGLGGR